MMPQRTQGRDSPSVCTNWCGFFIPGSFQGMATEVSCMLTSHCLLQELATREIILPRSRPSCTYRFDQIRCVDQISFRVIDVEFIKGAVFAIICTNKEALYFVTFAQEISAYTCRLSRHCFCRLRFHVRRADLWRHQRLI